MLDVSEKDLVARVGPLRPAAIVATREVTWIQALPKGEKMDSIVRDARSSAPRASSRRPRRSRS